MGYKSLVKNIIRKGQKRVSSNNVYESESMGKGLGFFNFLENFNQRNNPENFHSYFELDINKFSNFLKNSSAEKIEHRGKDMVIKLFKQASSNIPAYKDYLKKNKISPDKINDFSDFKSLPIISKKNYLRKYSIDDLNWKGSLTDLHMISVSSGLTGEPFYWPRGLGLEYETSLEHELALKYFFDLDRKKTLFIIGYAMGMYVAGVFTLNSLMNLVKKGYPLTIVSPGSDKESIIKIANNLGKKYDQVIIAAYSPVLKDIVDKGVREGVNWKSLNLKFISGGESFSEEFRDYIFKKIGSKNYLRTSMNTYGSADAAILGHETPLSILIRRLANSDKKLQKALFKQNRLPSLHQYYPFFKYFEEVDGNLVLSTFGGIPLIRYSIGDSGGIIPFDRMTKVLREFGIDIKKEMKGYSSENLIWHLPFVYLFGRKDNTKVYYGANIYPEHIKSCLEKDEVINLVTGKFFMDIIFDNNQNQDLYLAIELTVKESPESGLKKKISSLIHHNLIHINDEYRYLSQTIGNRIYPKVELFEFGDPKYFSPRIKPAYVKKQ